MRRNEAIIFAIILTVAVISLSLLQYDFTYGSAIKKTKQMSAPRTAVSHISAPVAYPPCQRTEPDCVKAQALFNTLMPLRTDQSTGTILRGAYDKNKEFTVHQFAVIYDALVMLPENVRSALKILMFSRDSLGQPWVAHPEEGSFYIAYDPRGTYRNWSNDRVLSCVMIHEIGHLVEESAGIQKPFRSICFDFVNDEWQQKPECEVYLDFAPQITFLSSENHNEWIWSNELRARTAGNDGREDIANTISYYVCAGNLFRTEARARPKMKEKYQFLKERLFNGKEYKCDLDGCLSLELLPTPCANNGCTSCSSIGASCTTSCNDCPAIAGCGPGGCKQWTCINNQCRISGK